MLSLMLVLGLCDGSSALRNKLSVKQWSLSWFFQRTAECFDYVVVVEFRRCEVLGNWKDTVSLETKAHKVVLWS
jgi:hypothetical protein